jgi:hypothetical protein
MIGTRDALPTRSLAAAAGVVEYFAGVEVEDVAARSLDIGECVAAEVETARAEGTALAPDEVRAWLIEQARAWLLVEHESDVDVEPPAASAVDMRSRLQAWVDDDDAEVQS